jgi:hypothetical protein
MRDWYKDAWTLHLEGHTTKAISGFIKIPVRQVQIAIKNQREKFPASIEERAMKDYIKRLSNGGYGVKHIRSMVKAVFRQTLSPACIEKIAGLKPKKPVKKAAKKATKRLIGRTAKKPIQAVCVTTPDKKKTVKKAVKKLAKRVSTKTDGRTKHIQVPKKVFVAMIRFLMDCGMSEQSAVDLAIRFEAYLDY